PRQSRRADLPNVVEQLFKEAAAAPQHRSLPAGRLDVHHQLLAGALNGGNIALLVKAHEQHGLAGDVRIAEGDLVHVTGDIIPVIRRELAGEARTTEDLFDRVPVVDAGLNAGDQLAVEHHALVLVNLRAAAKD